ncbi:MAG: hypothetical protein Q8P61_08330 [Candidatus Nanopelagicales bacterium]|nr:hypothetical protein [Candidatus Nanopelagicales bacterium]
MMYGYGNGWWMALMPFAWIVLIGLIVWAAIMLSKRPGEGSAGAAQPRETPREMLDRRLASGEIDLETYTRSCEAIARQGRPGP